MDAERRHPTLPRTIIIQYFPQSVKSLAGNGIAVNAAINAMLLIRQAERLTQLLLG